MNAMQMCIILTKFWEILLNFVTLHYIFIIKYIIKVKKHNLLN